MGKLCSEVRYSSILFNLWALQWTNYSSMICYFNPSIKCFQNTTQIVKMHTKYRLFTNIVHRNMAVVGLCKVMTVKTALYVGDRVTMNFVPEDSCVNLGVILIVLSRCKSSQPQVQMLWFLFWVCFEFWTCFKCIMNERGMFERILNRV